MTGTSGTSSPSRKFDIAAVVEFYLDKTVPHRDGFVKISCPTGDHDDNTPSATINRSTGRLHCFSCDFSGDAIDLVRYKEGLDFASAVTRCQEITHSEGLEISRAADGVQRRQPPTRLRDSGAPAHPGNRRTVSSGGRRKPRNLG